jgi:hypothetical protein
MTPIAARLLTARGASKPIPTPFRSDQAFAKDLRKGHWEGVFGSGRTPVAGLTGQSDRATA